MSQMMLVVAAVALLGILMVPAHKVSMNRQQVLLSTEATNTATAIAQELVEEIIVRKFDENKCGRLDTTINPNDFSYPPGLETSKGDTLGKTSTYDDVDDFHGYTSTISTPRLGNFVDTCRVYYVSENTPDIVSSVKTNVKRIDVKIRNPYIFSKDSTLTISKIISYRYRGGS